MPQSQLIDLLIGVFNILVILWRSVLLMEETGEPGGNRQPSASN